MTPIDAATGRRPAHAGSFYPSARTELAELVDRLLTEAAGRLPELRADGIRGVLVPHAGLMFSGPVAAAGWSALQVVQPDTVVVIGTEHAGRARGCAVWTAGAWQQALGDVAVERSLAGTILGLGPPFVADEQSHRIEHSVEVQLPFLARACPGARVIPMIVNTRSRDVAQAAGDALGRLLSDAGESKRVVVVASSDLAHYPPLQLARDVDALMLRAICRLDAARVLEDDEAACAASRGRLGCGLCGREATRIAIAATRRMGAVRGVLLEHATSVDFGHGDPATTVGYASVAFTE